MNDVLKNLQKANERAKKAEQKRFDQQMKNLTKANEKMKKNEEKRLRSLFNNFR